MNNKWKAYTAKQGTELYVSNNENNIFVAEAPIDKDMNYGQLTNGQWLIANTIVDALNEVDGG